MIPFNNVAAFAKRTGLFLCTVIIVLSACLYIQCNIYSFQEGAPFTGSSLYNPYGKDTGAVWSKANFHAHSIAWNHVTNGHQTPEEIINTYNKLDYDIVCISNYHSVANVKGANIHVPVYEHGYNIFKTHQLVFEPSRTSFFDLPFFQTISMKQSVLDALANESSCVGLNHPLIRDGYPDEELKKLSGYNFMEVLNHSANSVNKWDIVLSAGKPVWSLGNDDMHDATEESEVGVCWTMIPNVSNDQDVVDQLKKGNAYIVRGNKGIAENALKSLTVTGDTLLQLELTNVANTIRLIGQNGVSKQIEQHTDAAAYVFKPEDTYIRAEIINDNSIIYLNPVIRQQGHQPPVNRSTASVNIPATILYRLAVLLLCSGLLLLLYGRSFAKLILSIEAQRKRRQYRKSPGYSLGTT